MFSYKKAYQYDNQKRISLNQNNKQEKNKYEERINVSPLYRQKLLSPQILYICKRISVCLLFRRKKASMTVEAALALPVFLFAFLNLLSVVEIYRFQGNMSMAMHTTVKEMAVYGHAYSQMKEDPNRMESYGMTYLYGAGRVKSCMSDAYLARIPVRNGYSGIHWNKSSMMENQCIDLVATFQAKSMVNTVGGFTIPMYCRMRSRAWTGYEIPLVRESQEKEKIVYITPEGDAYHLSKSCSYLRLSIRSVDRKKVSTLRNQDRCIYYPCRFCGYKENNTVFITLYGNYYHTTMQCGGLKRTIEAVPISKTGERHLCSKCGGE